MGGFQAARENDDVQLAYRKVQPNFSQTVTLQTCDGALLVLFVEGVNEAEMLINAVEKYYKRNSGGFLAPTDVRCQLSLKEHVLVFLLFWMIGGAPAILVGWLGGFTTGLGIVCLA
ncbi:hypothetical protein V6N13_061185 [Hibiscus sabdariffa]